MKDWAELLKEFHEARGERVPLVLRNRVIALRLRLMMEELGETAVALQEGTSREKLLDGLCDLLYVVVGTAHVCGFGPILDAAFREVHRSNMTKDHGTGVQPGSGVKYGPLGKGANYESPNLRQFLVK